jgi:hypothetical protein
MLCPLFARNCRPSWGYRLVKGNTPTGPSHGGTIASSSYGNDKKGEQKAILPSFSNYWFADARRRAVTVGLRRGPRVSAQEPRVVPRSRTPDSLGLPQPGAASLLAQP